MNRTVFTDRQVMLDPYFEVYHYCDQIPPVVDFHQHSFYEIFFFLSGNVTYNIEGKVYRLRPGDILLTNNLDIHRPEITPGKTYERFVIWLSDTFFDRVCMYGEDIKSCFADASSRDYRLIRPDQASLVHLRTLCEHICESQKSSELGNRVLSTSYLLQFLVHLSRCYYNVPRSFLSDVTENGRINQVITYINDNISSNLSLDSLAAHFFTSKFYLCKQFRNFTGMSIYQYIMKKRLTISLNLLQKGMPVTSACYDCGFNDYSNFLKAFKREFGRNPKEFIKGAG